MSNQYPEPILQLNNLKKSFAGVRALQSASLNVYRGRVMALIGENGAGKSTMMRILTGIYHKDAGKIIYLGKEINFSNVKASQEAGISIIHQELSIIPNLTVAENIFLNREFTLKIGKIKSGIVDWNKTYQQANALLKKLNVNFTAEAIAGDLSIGQLKMVEIAKAISFESQVIIMDEPTDALTDNETQALFGIINELKHQGKGIVYISHRLKEIFDICDDITILRDGQFIDQVKVDQINQNRLIEMMVGRKLEQLYPYIEPLPNAITRLEVINLTGDIVENCSFKVNQGEILGVSGLMGSGRTQLMKLIYGALPLSSGEIYLNQQKLLAKLTPEQAINYGIVYISEDRKTDGLILTMNIGENMTLNALNQFSRFGWINTQQERQEVSKFINQFNINPSNAQQNISLLSGGNQQKVAIAKGLICKPQILILDEPTRGVDVGAKKEIYSLINKFKMQGLSIILISSDMPEVLGISDRIMVMSQGKISATYSRKQANQELLLSASLVHQ